MEEWEGKNFSITDPQGVNTVVYQINRTRKGISKRCSTIYTRKTRLYGRITWRNEKKNLFCRPPI